MGNDTQFNRITNELVDSLSCAKDRLAFIEPTSPEYDKWLALKIGLDLTLNVLSEQGHI